MYLLLCPSLCCCSYIFDICHRYWEIITKQLWMWMLCCLIADARLQCCTCRVRWRDITVYQSGPQTEPLPRWSYRCPDHKFSTKGWKLPHFHTWNYCHFLVENKNIVSKRRRFNDLFSKEMRFKKSVSIIVVSNWADWRPFCRLDTRRTKTVCLFASIV